MLVTISYNTHTNISTVLIMAISLQVLTKCPHIVLDSECSEECISICISPKED